MTGTWLIILGFALWVLGVVLNGALLALCLMAAGALLIVIGANLAPAIRED